VCVCVCAVALSVICVTFCIQSDYSINMINNSTFNAFARYLLLLSSSLSLCSIHCRLSATASPPCRHPFRSSAGTSCAACGLNPPDCLLTISGLQREAPLTGLQIISTAYCWVVCCKVPRLGFQGVRRASRARGNLCLS
jgi:hypothetical protein